MLNAKLLVLTLKNAVVGVVVAQGKVSRAAPMVRYMVGWDENKVWRWCAIKAWDCYEHVKVADDRSDASYRMAVLDKSPQENYIANPSLFYPK